jgi:hypothetical protein
VELQLRLLELAEGVLDRCSDTTGAVMGFFHRGVEVLASLARAAETQPEALVEPVAELPQVDGYGQFAGLIPALAPLLGDEGLWRLEEALLERGGAVRLRPALLARHGSRGGQPAAQRRSA